MIVRVQPRARGAWFAQVVRTLPLVIAAAAICVVQVGWVATVVIIVVGLVGLVAVLRALTRISRRRLHRRSEGTSLLLAEASMAGKPGVVTITTGTIEWTARRHGLVGLSPE